MHVEKVISKKYIDNNCECIECSRAGFIPRSMLKLASYSLTRKTLPAFQHPSCNIQATDVSMSYRIYFQL